MSESPLSVAMVSAGFFPALGGAERQALELSTALARRGVEVEVLTRRVPGLPAREVVRGIRVRRLWCAGEGLANALTFMASCFWALWSEGHPRRAIHAHLGGSPALAAALAGRALSAPVFVKLGGGRGIGELASSARTRAGRLKLAALSWLAPRFIAVTEDLAEECSRYLGGARALVVPNGVDTERFAPVPRRRKEALRRELGWPAGGPVFLYAGRLSPEKRLPWLLEAWASSAARDSSVVVLVGEGPERPELERLRGALAPGRALLMPPVEDMAPLFAAADAFVLPSVSEGLSNALLEAMASGLAVAGSKVGGTAEAVRHGVNGLLFEPEDRAGLVAALERLARDPEELRRLGEASRRAALEAYSMERVAARYEALYRGEA